MKAYLVSSGEYSDYQIIAVFLDREAAEKMSKEEQTSSFSNVTYRVYNDVEEFDIKEPLPKLIQDLIDKGE